MVIYVHTPESHNFIQQTHNKVDVEKVYMLYTSTNILLQAAFVKNCERRQKKLKELCLRFSEQGYGKYCLLVCAMV
jgi:hypothetical protein